MKSIKHLLCIFLLFSLTSACDSLPKDWDWGFRPSPLNGTAGFPSAKTEYGAGFKEGCSIGWSSVGTGILSEAVPMNLSPERITKSPDFRNGWWDGFEQCVYIVDWDVI